MSLMKGARTAAKKCMCIKSKEKVLILTDKKMTKLIPESLEKASLEITENVDLQFIKRPKRDGEEPEKKVAQMMKKYDVIFIVTSKSLTHTKAVKNASKKARIASMPGISEYTFKKGALTADYEKVKKLTRLMIKYVKKAKTIKLTSKNGTDLRLKVDKYKWFKDDGMIHKPGVKNLPGGEVYTAPDEKKSNGFLFIDKFGEYGENIKIIVEDGYAKKFQGSPKLKKEVKKIGKKARNIAEIGIGTNPRAKLIKEKSVLESEKVFGTVHIALGNNKFAGGKVGIPFHVDGIIKKPTLEADKKILIKNGKWQIKK